MIIQMDIKSRNLRNPKNQGLDSDNIHRYVSLSQEMTKDKTSGGLGIDLTIDNVYFLGRTKEVAVRDENGKVVLDKNGKAKMETVKISGLEALKDDVGESHYFRNYFNDPKLADPKNGGIIMSAEESAFHGEGNIKSISEICKP